MHLTFRDHFDVRLTNSVDEQLRLGREIVVDDIIKTRDVKASGSHVGHN